MQVISGLKFIFYQTLRKWIRLNSGWWSSTMLEKFQVEMETWHFTFLFAELTIVRNIFATYFSVCMCVCVSLCAHKRLCIRLAQIASQSIGPVVKLCLPSNSTYSMQFMPKNLHKSSDWPLVFSFISLALSQSMWKHSNGELIKKTVKKCVFASSGASLVFPIPLWMPCLFSKMCSLVFGEREKKKGSKVQVYSGWFTFFLHSS